MKCFMLRKNIQIGSCINLGRSQKILAIQNNIIFDMFENSY